MLCNGTALPFTGFLKAHTKHIFTKLMHIVEHSPPSVILKDASIFKTQNVQQTVTVSS
jgi:hypothetical protein